MHIKGLPFRFLMPSPHFRSGVGSTYNWHSLTMSSANTPFERPASMMPSVPNPLPGHFSMMPSAGDYERRPRTISNTANIHQTLSPTPCSADSKYQNRPSSRVSSDDHMYQTYQRGYPSQVYSDDNTYHSYQRRHPSQAYSGDITFQRRLSSPASYGDDMDLSS